MGGHCPGESGSRLPAVVRSLPDKARGGEGGYHASCGAVELVAGDMFTDAAPRNVILLSNVLHDWDVPECRVIVDRCAAGLPSGGRLLVHDVCGWLAAAGAGHR